jgi:hypothetical protein
MLAVSTSAVRVIGTRETMIAPWPEFEQRLCQKKTGKIGCLAGCL